MNYRIKSVEVPRYPVLRITFEDGLSGEIDMTQDIETGPIFAPLKDESYFRAVKVGDRGLTYGWNLDDPGHEIDFCPDSVRIRFESEIVEKLAEEYRRHLVAAE
jgi:hypothetical protein